MHLTDPLTTHFRLAETQRSAMAKLGVMTVRELLFHFPFRYDTGGAESSIAGLVAGMDATIVGTIEKLETKKSWKRKIPISEGVLRDTSGKIKMMFFNQPYIARMWAEGTRVQATGKVAGKGDKIYLANPQLQRISIVEENLFKAQHEHGVEKSIDLETQEYPSKKSSGRLSVQGDAVGFQTFSQDIPESPGLFAVYPESRGVSSLWFRHAIAKVLTPETIEQVEDPIPLELLKRYNLPTLRTALVWMHTPEKLKEAEAARKRFAFEEIFLIQLQRQQERRLQSHEKSFVIDVPKKQVEGFMSTFPFTATPAQMHAVGAILGDMRTGAPMSRLLEGDVGSGKTAVAATAAYVVVNTRPTQEAGTLTQAGTLQVAYMAPTEILAKQHFESFIHYFETAPINIGLITGSGCFKFPSKVGKGQSTTISRAQLLKWVANGEIPILIGTHALIEKSVQFKHLALVVIDEQHRFGTNQRRTLAHKHDRLPHLLSMTATPIPRTLALTVYGDLDLTLLDQMPPGRKPIITEIVKPDERPKAYAKMREQLAAGRQAYVICPRIEEPDPEKAFALMAKSVTAEAKRLKKEVFQEYSIEILHSKMTPKEKEDTMARFSNHEIDILVATSVVEVGVNVPNATIIFIEGAERFGLAQLHQLRGRVVRSNHQAYCFVCPETRGEATMTRLKALVTAKNGFELAEKDLLQRGAGELAGRKQWGISDIGMDALKNLKLVEAARTEALQLIDQDEHLSRYPLLREAIHERAKSLHFE